VAGHHVPENVENREGKGEAGHLNHRTLLLQVLATDISVFIFIFIFHIL
jgi:hypothetical protein